MSKLTSLPLQVKIYEVGGAVRDALLGLLISDRDYVVVGATPEQMIAAGFRPVGKDFPVFLHPTTQDEYALARTERKTAKGYHGFAFQASPEVTLEEDLARRDLTINAIAKSKDGEIIDPFHGQRDIEAKMLRHVSPAFAEDPVRILRLARFSARFTTFTITSETNALMREMVQAGEVDALVAERVWQELARGLMEAKPSLMFAVLAQCGALERLLPELNSAHFGLMDLAAQQHVPLTVRFALLCNANQQHPLAQAAITKLCQRLAVPGEARDLAILLAAERDNIITTSKPDAEHTVRVLERCDALRKPARFAELLIACELGRDANHKVMSQASHFKQALALVQAVNTGAIAQVHAGQPQHIKQAVHEARVAAVRELTKEAALPSKT